jgi:hypothetical protein
VTLGAGPEGFKDWQRYQLFDGPQLLELEEHKVNEEPVFGRFQVSRFLSLCGRVSSSPAAGVRMKLTWWSAQTGGVVVGERNVYLFKQLRDWNQINLLHLGPWLEVTFSGTAGTISCNLFASNRLPEALQVPQDAVLCAVAHAFAGAGSISVYPAGYFAGPVQIRLFSQGASLSFVDVEVAQSAVPGYDAVDRVVAPGNALVMQRVVFPLSAMRLGLHCEGAETVELVATPFITGSS